MLFSWTRRALLTAIGTSALTVGLDTVSRADAIPVKPKGAVILTIAGDITHTNRTAYDPKLDGFMKYHEIEFSRAFAFDLAMLEDFQMRKIRCQPPQYSSSATFQGPLLRDVLKALGAEGTSIQTRALDGYAVDLTAQKIAEKDWILATRTDGRPFGIDDKGPI